MKPNKKFILGMMVVPLALVGIGLTYASSVTTPNTFVGGTMAVASEVNANFAAHAAAINGNDSDLRGLMSAPAFHATMSVTPTVFAVGDVVVCDNEELDEFPTGGITVAGAGYSPTLGRYKAPRSGIYKFSFHTNMMENGVITLKKNTIDSIGSVWELEDGDTSCSITVIVRLAAGDEVRPVVEGSSVELFGSNGDRKFTSFSGHWLRP